MSTSLEHTQKESPAHTHPARNTVSNHRLSGLEPELEPNPDLAAISLTTHLALPDVVKETIHGWFRDDALPWGLPL